MDADIRYIAPSLAGCDENCTDYALGEIFAGADLEPKALVDALGAAESYLYTPQQLDFDSQVERSFLPDMLQIANANNVKLVFVRIKVESGHEDSPELNAYLARLDEYLNGHNGSLLDFGSDQHLTHDLFRDPLHLNEQGQMVFTQLVADGLKGLLINK